MGTFVLKRKTFNIPPNIGNTLKQGMEDVEQETADAGRKVGAIKSNFNRAMNQANQQIENQMAKKVQNVANSIKQTNNAYGEEASKQVGYMVGTANAGIRNSMANGMKNAMNNGQV